MNSIEIFTKALGLQRPWAVTKVEFVENSDGGFKELHLWLDFEKGHKFVIGEGEAQAAHDTMDKTWRHLDFFRHHCYLHARVPRVRISDNSVKLVDVPWARQGSVSRYFSRPVPCCS